MDGERPAVPRLHRQGNALVVSVPDPITEHVFASLGQDVFPALREKEIDRIVFDLAAVESVDTRTLQLCERLVETARLLGATVALAAIQPHVAGAATELGDFLDGVLTSRSIHAAMETLQIAVDQGTEEGHVHEPAWS